MRGKAATRFEIKNEIRFCTAWLVFVYFMCEFQNVYLFGLLDGKLILYIQQGKFKKAPVLSRLSRFFTSFWLIVLAAITLDVLGGSPLPCTCSAFP